MVLVAPFPPAIFVGRAPELERLGELVVRVPVAVVVGVPGVGKSALACAAAARWPTVTAQRTVRPGESLATVADDLRRTVARRRVREPSDDDDRLVDLARRLDEAGALVVLDDLHALAADEQRQLVDTLGARLRVGRLVVTSRERLPATTRADYGVVQVPPLDEATARELWRRLDELYGPSDGFAAAWTRAAGSPLVLRQAHAAEPLGDDPAASVIDALGDDERTLAAALALGDLPLPLTLLDQLVPGGGRAPLRRLVRRLVVDVDGADVAHLHDLFRAAVLARLGDDDARAIRLRLAALLPSSSADPVARVREAARHLCAAGEPAAAAELLLEHAADFIRAGAAGELRRALLRVPAEARSRDLDVALARTLIRQLDLRGAFDALATLAAAERPPRPELGLSFGLVAMLNARLDEAEAVLRSVVDHAEATATQRLRARINLAVVRSYRGDAAGSDALLAAADGDAGDDVQRGTVALGRVMILWLVERDAAAMLPIVERARTLLAACATFRGTVLAPALAAAACSRNGRFDECDELLARSDAAQRDNEDARMQLTARAIGAVCSYERGRARVALDELAAVRAAFDRAGDRLGVLFIDGWIGRALVAVGRRSDGLALLASTEAAARARGIEQIAALCARARAWPATGDPSSRDPLHRRAVAALAAARDGRAADAARDADAVLHDGDAEPPARAIALVARALPHGPLPSSPDGGGNGDGGDAGLVAAIADAVVAETPLYVADAAGWRLAAAAPPGALVLDARTHTLANDDDDDDDAAAAAAAAAPAAAVALARRPAQRRLLYRLARAPGAVVDKEALAAALWPDVPYHPLVHDGVLKVHVRNLRLALAATPLSIESADGGGYRLVAPAGFVFVEPLALR